jgi:hypothetical protein
MTIMAAAAVLLPAIAYAQSSTDGVRDSSSNAAPLPVVKVNEPGEAWTFAVWTFRKYPRHSTIKLEPHGVFTSPNECNIARAKKIAQLDEGDYRQPHLLPDWPTITTTTTVGARSITTEQPGSPEEWMNVSNCEAEKFSTDSQMAQKN